MLRTLVAGIIRNDVEEVVIGVAYGRDSMPIYNKLVRDHIPNIIERAGNTCRTRILDDEEYMVELNAKLQEELTEYMAATTSQNALEELADMMEILHALADAHGSSPEELEQIRKEKAAVRGGFKERIYLIDVDDA